MPSGLLELPRQAGTQKITFLQHSTKSWVRIWLWMRFWLMQHAGCFWSGLSAAIDANKVPSWTTSLMWQVATVEVLKHEILYLFYYHIYDDLQEFMEKKKNNQVEAFLRLGLWCHQHETASRICFSQPNRVFGRICILRIKQDNLSTELWKIHLDKAVHRYVAWSWCICL